MTPFEELIEAGARNFYCAGGNAVRKPWEDAPEYAKQAARNLMREAISAIEAHRCVVVPVKCTSEMIRVHDSIPYFVWHDRWAAYLSENPYGQARDRA